MTISWRENNQVKESAEELYKIIKKDKEKKIKEKIIKKEKEESIVNHALEEILFIERAKSLMLLTKLSKDKDINPVRLKNLESYTAEITKKQDVSVCK